MLSSILIGFGLASLVTLVAEESSSVEATVVRVGAGLWVFSSILLLAVLVLAEVVRRLDPSDTLISMSPSDQRRVVQRCESLLQVFVLALLLMAIGIVVVSFHFSLVHGLAALVAVVFVVWLMWRVLR